MGKRQLAHAWKVLKSSGVSDVEAAKLAGQITAVEHDLAEQAALARGTLYGTFPLARISAVKPLGDSDAANYELVADPTITAMDAAAKGLIAHFEQPRAGIRQLDTVVVTVPRNLQFENRLIYSLNASSKFAMHSFREVSGALTESELAELSVGRVTPAVRTSLMHALDAPGLLVIVARLNDVADDIYAYTLEGKVFRTASEASWERISVNGFSRDRRDRLVWLVLNNLAMLAAGYLGYALAAYGQRTTRTAFSLRNLLLLPLVGFAVGRLTPLAFLPIIGSIRPGPQTAASLSFWLPCLAGLVFVIGPLFVYWAVSARLARFWSSVHLLGRGGAVFAAIGAGAAAALGDPLLLYLDQGQLVCLVSLAISVIAIAYVAGRALDSADPLRWELILAAPLFAAAMGAAVFHAEAVWLELLALLTIASVFGLARFTRTKPHRQLAVGSGEDAEALRLVPAVPADLPSLIARTASPCYQKFSFYEDAWQHLSEVCEGRVCHLALFGARGAGKTATAETLLEQLKGELQQRNLEPLVFKGTCSRPMGEPTPYAPFRQAMAQCFAVNLMAPAEPKLEQIGRTLGGALGSIVPFASILFPASTDDGESAARQKEIVNSLVWKLGEMAKTRPVLLLLDDVQWLDAPSKELLNHLLASFSHGEPTRFAILLTADEKASLADLDKDLPQHSMEIKYPIKTERSQILVGGVGLEPLVAEEILDHVGEPTQSHGGLLWLFQTVGNLARAEALVGTPQGFTWREGHWPAGFPVPGHMRAMLEEQLARVAEYRTIIECAACEGREFHASVLAEALGRPRLELLMALGEIERRTGLLHDVRDQDDLYAFQSSFLLEVVRNQLEIFGHGPRNLDVPQIVREYHACLAAALEATLEKNTSRFYEIANHYYAAGSRYAARGMEFCLRVVRAGSGECDFLLASRYLDMAKECAEITGEQAAIEAARLLMDCRKAHVQGQREEHVQAAQNGLCYLEEHAESPARVVLAVAQACYDAGKSCDETTWSHEALRLGQQVFIQAVLPKEQAEALHFVGISLLQPAERTAELRKAIEVLQPGVIEEDREAACLLGRIYNSLGAELSHGNSEEREEARELFMRRIELDERLKLHDRRGLAMTHGGLGRLAFYGQPPDLSAAQLHFERDLEISEALGDAVGQVKMHSFLAACELGQGELDGAIRHYRQSWSLAKAHTDRFFAGVGLLECYQRQRCEDGLGKTARELLGLAEREGIPSGCVEQLRSVLTGFLGKFPDEALAALFSRVEKMS
ncbi:MAG: AAA family ATPase [Planctomycetota bacterium]